MRWFWISLAIVLIVFGGGYFLLQFSSPAREFSVVSDNANELMTLKSSAFTHNGRIPAQYSCDGDDINPPLEITGVPEDTISLALIMHDPDAPRDGGWTHWVIWNMNSDTQQIEEGNEPDSGVIGASSSGDNSYGGPCPPEGTHHYNFTLYALSKEIDLPESSGKEELEEAMDGGIISKTILTGLYSRD